MLALWQGLPPGQYASARPRVWTGSLSTAAGDHVVLEVQVDDRAARDVAAVGALVVKVDGQEKQSILMTPGTGRTSYDALVGPLAGRRAPDHVASGRRSGLGQRVCRSREYRHAW